MHLLLIAARFLHFAATASLVGTFAFCCLVARPALAAGGAAGILARLAWASLAVAFLSGAAWLVATAAGMSGEALSGSAVGTVLTETQFGEDWLLRLALAAALAICLALRRRGRVADWFALALSAGLIATLAWSGHGAATPGEAGRVHLVADILHLLAAGAWLGALLPLWLVLAAAQHDGGAAAARAAHAVVLRFSMLGVVCVATLALSGVVNTWFLVGSVAALGESDYGRLLLIKLALVAAMIALAAVNRVRLTPRLAGDAAATRPTIRRLRRNTLGEVSLGLLVVAIVGVLGTLPPAGHMRMHMTLENGVFRTAAILGWR